MDFTPSPRARELAERVRHFIANEIAAVEDEHVRELHAAHRGGDWTQWRVSPRVEALKAKARDAGLWNFFLELPALDYAVVAEAMGWSLLAPEIFNCNAPDSGNMEVLAHFGTAEQKEGWLQPLLAGEIRSVFCMTEPDVASSDATNLRATIRDDGDTLVLDGRKWWTTGLGHPRAKVAIFMGISNPDGDRHRQHSMVLVPLDTPGVHIERMLPAFGDYDEPYGHGEVTFTNVRVPKANLIAGLGRGFEIAQSRLGPGRIHHCMRAIGAAERALSLMIERGLARVAFGKPLLDLGGNRERIAELRIAIDQARLLTLHAAWRIDTAGAAASMSEISAIKVVAPNVLQRVADEAIQLFGGAGMSHDVPLTTLFAMARALRIADGPDAVHLGVIARHELRKHQP
ncbi:MAG: acyl-CoA dehydrogenase family protein [Acidobacteria bacterium]|nr:acyl-CoA dehydrogenase family protein [Acidobacteriota bacterium]MBV9476953.1 acyl-CoA dehydrogenase family protein [Acidobacteriota bacterium]